jgi:uncharacterized membrane protein
VALVSWRFLLAEVELVMPDILHHAQDRPLALFAHIGLAPVALALLPLQFHAGLRRRRPGLHRWLGRLYGVSILISGAAGAVLALITAEGAVAASGFLLLSLAWLGTTARAVWLAMQRRIAEHRAWMIRSAALTLAAVTLRLQLPLGAATLGFEASYPLIAWACLVPNLVIAEWLLRPGSRL